jgi:hypothetical protein
LLWRKRKRQFTSKAPYSFPPYSVVLGVRRWDSDVYAQRLLPRITLLCRAFQAPLCRGPYGDGELGRGL